MTVSSVGLMLWQERLPHARVVSFAVSDGDLFTKLNYRIETSVQITAQEPRIIHRNLAETGFQSGFWGNGRYNPVAQSLGANQREQEGGVVLWQLLLPRRPFFHQVPNSIHSHAVSPVFAGVRHECSLLPSADSLLI